MKSTIANFNVLIYSTAFVKGIIGVWVVL